ncbi:response regulator transcription factor [Nocardioides pantholopis]|uniref:response regulator transcription factor n=1 Tax=Nocardioides pantholopis TaxID=2483798 RepID=UPI000F089E1F|nr:response regulator transcription factor [Nocardioides pantholopis]
MDGDAQWTAVIVEDDPDVRDLIDIVLTQSGFRTVVAGDGPAGVEAVREHRPLLTTLDVNMPGMDGFAVAKRLREFSDTYLIMITALSDEIDVVQGFEAGADDYLVKPFRPRELRARADSMLRRPRPHAVPAAAEAAQVPDADWVRFADLALDPGSRAVTVRGVPVELDRPEFDLLASLLETGPRVRSKADLVLTMRGRYATSYFVTEADKNSVEEHLASLRRKLGDQSGRARYVEAVGGVGYRMAEPG